MTDQMIACPNCKTEIPLNSALSAQIGASLEKDFQEKMNIQDKALKQREAEMKSQLEKLELEKSSLSQEVEKRLSLERQKLQQTAEIKAKADLSVEMTELQKELIQKSTQLNEAKKQELELRRQRQEMEDREKNLELEIQKKVDDEKQKIRANAEQQAVEQGRLKLMEKDKQIDNMLKQIDELKRKGEQGSQKLQGEVLELDIEDMLRSTFTMDNISPILSGARGADIKQQVVSFAGTVCGNILFEVKQTKNWSDGWIDKVKDDLREAKADVAVIITTALPSEIKNFGMIRGVWVANYDSFLGLVFALRSNLLQLQQTRLMSVGKNEKMELLYSYLSGNQFKQRVECNRKR